MTYKRIGRSLERGQPRTDDKHGPTEASKRPLHTARPEEQSTNSVDGQSSDERPPIARFAYNPARVGERANEVSSKVCAVKKSQKKKKVITDNAQTGGLTYPWRPAA